MFDKVLVMPLPLLLLVLLLLLLLLDAGEGRKGGFRRWSRNTHMHPDCAVSKVHAVCPNLQNCRPARGGDVADLARSRGSQVSGAVW